MQPTVQILLATYNGERFLREQLNSLFSQTFLNFSILIRDDGSTDKTIQIIEAYQQKYLGKIELLKDYNQNVGATQNFGILLQHATADYVFFCDQDDIWVENKIEISLKKLQEMELENSDVPCMIYSDMQSIDETGTITSTSVWKQLHLQPKYFTLNRLLVQNIPHGCTMGINKAMRKLATPLPSEIILHDHWIALLAAVCGKHYAFTTPLVHLRNHTQNVTRKKSSLKDKYKRFTTNLFSKETYEYFIQIRVAQAKALLLRVQTQITSKQSEMLQAFIQLEHTKGFARKKIFLRYHFFRTTFKYTFKIILRA